MKQIEENIREIVKKIKADNRMKHYCFVKGFAPFDYADPLDDFLVAVNIMDTQIDMQFISDKVGENLEGELCTTNVKFRIYAPKNNGGAGLLSLAQSLCEVIKDTDDTSMCKDIKISSISYDVDAVTVYRDVIAQFSFCLYKEVTG